MSIDEMEDLRNKVNEIHNCIIGDYKSAGLISRITKLEELSATINKVLFAIGIPVIMIVINSIWKLMSSIH